MEIYTVLTLHKVMLLQFKWAQKNMVVTVIHLFMILGTFSCDRRLILQRLYAKACEPCVFYS